MVIQKSKLWRRNESLINCLCQKTEVVSQLMQLPFYSFSVDSNFFLFRLLISLQFAKKSRRNVIKWLDPTTAFWLGADRRNEKGEAREKNRCGAFHRKRCAVPWMDADGCGTWMNPFDLITRCNLIRVQKDGGSTGGGFESAIHPKPSYYRVNYLNFKKNLANARITRLQGV